MTNSPFWTRIVPLVIGLVVASGCRRAEQPETPRLPSGRSGPELGALLAEFNRGAALMEQYKYREAARAFEKVLEQAPDWTAARFNLGLAYLNLQEEKGAASSMQRAREIFEAILAENPDHLHARFCLGMYYQHAGKMKEAAECFRQVHQADPEDPYAAYKYADVLMALERYDEAVPILEELVGRDPGFMSGILLLARARQRRGQTEGAMKLLRRFEELRKLALVKDHFLVDRMYGAAGKYYTVLDAGALPVRRQPPTPSPRILLGPDPQPLDQPLRAWQLEQARVELPGIAVGDVDRDNDLDLCLAAAGERGRTMLWLNDGAGHFSPGPVLADYGVSPCFGDVDNDGDLDLWLGRAGPDQLWLNDGNGHFSVAHLAGVTVDDVLTTSARLADVDSDGDLDLLASHATAGTIPASPDMKPAETTIFNNNRDGTFENTAAKLGLDLPQTPVAALVYDDFDGDRDLDLLLLAAGTAPSQAWVNYRAGRFQVRAASDIGLTARNIVGATSGDPDKDGDRDLLVFSRDGLQLFLNQGDFTFQADEGFNRQFAALAPTSGQFADMDNDGDLDIVLADAVRPGGRRGPVILVNDWPQRRFLDALQKDPGMLLAAIHFSGPASCVAADFTGNGHLDLLLAPSGEKPLLIKNVTQGGHWIQLDLVGTRPREPKCRSNNSAIGARVEVKSGTISQQVFVGQCAGAVAMAPLRLHVGLGEHTTVQWLRIIWPDAVLQGEVEVPADQVATIEEIQRKTSSCPHLFAWDGQRFAFVSDFGGVGGLGYLLAPGVYARPDPTEYVPIAKLEPRDGQFVLQVTEPLEEVVYFDEAKLIAVDHPKGTAIFPHEMAAVSLPPPPFELFVVRRRIEPIRATDHRGMDVTERLRDVDRRYAGATRPDPRFAGYAEEHFVQLDFGDRLAGLRPDQRLLLVACGWVEYSYSSTNFAAAQAGLRLEAPSLLVQRDGRWVTLLKEAGYPAGIQHTMTLDLTGLVRPGDRHFRLTTNMELFWDQIFLAVPEAKADLKIAEVAPSGAHLHYLGYPREFSPDGRQPNLLDYSNIDPSAPWKLMAGHYTRFGEVAELLQEADDCFVIMGRGEELTLRFPADAFGPVPEGYQRSYLLKTVSFCKDMDLYTAFPDTVEPLPFHGMSGYPYGPDEKYPDTEKTRRYRQTYNTRRAGR